MRVALVYDRVNKYGGAERVLLALHELWPEAPLYTAVYDPKKATWAKVFCVKPSFLQNIPFVKNNHEWFAWATPLAFESFDFSSFDLVISVTSAEAKHVITHPQTLHLCYCLTPTRYLWSGHNQYLRRPGGKWPGLAKWGLKYLASTLRRWDLIGSARPDVYIAISEHVKQRIIDYYGRRVSAVIYPPVDIDMFSGRPKRVSVLVDAPKDYYLVVSRLVGYKRLDLIIGAFNRLAMPLVIIGSGAQDKELQKSAGPTIIFVKRHLTDEELVEYYEQCKAFVFAADEDFGIVAVEAQACGKPVIAYRNSGVSEIVIDGRTGILFDQQSVDGVVGAICDSMKMQFLPETCRANAKRFGKKRFLAQFRALVNSVAEEFNNI